MNIIVVPVPIINGKIDLLPLIVFYLSWYIALKIFKYWYWGEL